MSLSMAADVAKIAKALEKLNETLEKLLKHLQENVIQTRDSW